MTWLELVGLLAMSALYVGAGVMHFVRPRFFVKMMPPQLPWHRELVALSGVAEIGLGLALLVPVCRPYAAWGVIALLIAVFPSNVYAAVAKLPGRGGYARLPFQLVLIAWAWWYTAGVTCVLRGV